MAKSSLKYICPCVWVPLDEKSITTSPMCGWNTACFKQTVVTRIGKDRVSYCLKHWLEHRKRHAMDVGPALTETPPPKQKLLTPNPVDFISYWKTLPPD